MRPKRARAPASHGFGFLDENAKREVRRALMKAVAIPGYQVPYASREMPIARGFGTGGLQITLSMLGENDTIKVIDQGSDESVNAANLRKFFTLVCPGVAGTTRTQDASIVQTRHRIPERPLRSDQILVLQVPYPDPLSFVEANGARRSEMHGSANYARLWTKLYEDMVTFHEIAISHRYPARIAGHYVIDPSPIPRWDVPKLNMAACLYLFGAGREKRIYAVPPYTSAEPLSFSDVPFRVEDFKDARGERHRCARCGSAGTFLDELLSPDGSRTFQCSDTDYCSQILEAKPCKGS